MHYLLFVFNVVFQKNLKCSSLFLKNQKEEVYINKDSIKFCFKIKFLDNFFKVFTIDLFFLNIIYDLLKLSIKSYR